MSVVDESMEHESNALQLHEDLSMRIPNDLSIAHDG